MVDAVEAGGVASDVVPYARRAVPIVAGVPEAVALGANVLVIGVAPFGGALTPEWRVGAAGGDRGRAERRGRAAHRARRRPGALGGGRRGGRRAARPARGAARPERSRQARLERPDVRVVHTVGSDCAIGKMSVTLELDAAARARGLESAFVATGQTGIAITGWGIAVDHVISDFVSGAASRLVAEGASRAPLLFVEGQGALGHPAYSGVTLGLLHGCLPDVLVLCHRAGATHIDDYPETPIAPLAELVAVYEGVAGWVRPARVRRDRAEHARARRGRGARGDRAGQRGDRAPGDRPGALRRRADPGRGRVSPAVAADVHIALRDGSTAHVRPVVAGGRARAARVPRRALGELALAALLLARRQPRQGRGGRRGGRPARGLRPDRHDRRRGARRRARGLRARARRPGRGRLRGRRRDAGPRAGDGADRAPRAGRLRARGHDVHARPSCPRTGA